ncbi:MAG TPA: hypothetical protein VIJ43_16060 [Burkholderiales bacterium]
MSPSRLSLFPLSLLLALANSAFAQDDARSTAAAGVFPKEFDQAVYKGLVGSALDAIPMDPSQRVGLQRTNAVVSNTLFGRSLAAWAGLSNPVLLLGGLVWGMWAASNIKPAEAEMKLASEPGQSGGDAATQERLVALLAPAAAVDDPPANKEPEPILVSSISAGDADVAVVSPSHVVKIWLPQRSPMLPQ